MVAYLDGRTETFWHGVNGPCGLGNNPSRDARILLGVGRTGGAAAKRSALLALSQAEFNRLVGDHGPTLYRIAYRMVGDRHEAEDLVQDTYRSAWKSRCVFRAGAW